MQVRVCAVIPVLNEEEFIKRCIDSLLAQTFPVRIMVLDGGSTDSTLDILDSYGDSISVTGNRKACSQCKEFAYSTWVKTLHIVLRLLAIHG